jgi:hypothetical protein
VEEDKDKIFGCRFAHFRQGTMADDQALIVAV